MPGRWSKEDAAARNAWEDTKFTAWRVAMPTAQALDCPPDGHAGGRVRAARYSTVARTP